MVYLALSIFEQDTKSSLVEDFAQQQGIGHGGNVLDVIDVASYRCPIYNTGECYHSFPKGGSEASISEVNVLW